MIVCFSCVFLMAMGGMVVVGGRDSVQLEGPLLELVQYMSSNWKVYVGGPECSWLHGQGYDLTTTAAHRPAFPLLHDH